MPFLRERAKLNPRKQITETHLDTKWTLREKKKLLIALRKLKPDKLEQIHSEYLPHRTEKEISWFIERMKTKGSRRASDSRPKVPIELWEKMSEELTCHDIDHSFALAEVFQKIANEEEHFPKNLPENPDWKMIYLYVAALLKGDEPPEVGQIEAAVLLDLTESLAKHLKSLDTNEQRSMMIRKYDLLAARVNARSSEEAFDLTRRALDEDPADFHSSHGSHLGTSQGSQPSTSQGSQLGTSQGSHQGASGKNTLSTNNLQGTNDELSSQPAGTQSVSVEPSGQNKTPTTNQTHPSATSVRTGSLRILGMRSNPSRRGRKRKTADVPVLLSNLQKTALYSINPFCIPVRYLNPKIKPSTMPTGASSTASLTSTEAKPPQCQV